MGHTREMIRDLLRLMPDEADERSHGYANHLCGDYYRYGTCIICASRRSTSALVHVALLRRAEILEPEMLNTELLLLDIVGQIKYNNMVREQTRAFCSGPSMNCVSCGAKLKMYIPYIEAYKNLMSRIHRLRCSRCEYVNEFTYKNIPQPKGVEIEQLRRNVPTKRKQRKPSRRIPTVSRRGTTPIRRLKPEPAGRFATDTEQPITPPP